MLHGYWCDAPAEEWFLLGDRQMGLAEWQRLSGEQGGKMEKYTFPDPMRTSRPT